MAAANTIVEASSGLKPFRFSSAWTTHAAQRAASAMNAPKL
jgi:hypothetical protein